MCLYCEYVVFDLEFSGFVVDFEFFLIWILNFLGKKETQNFFFFFKNKTYSRGCKNAAIGLTFSRGCEKTRL